MTSENTNLSPELMEKAKACTSPEELADLAKEGSLELSFDELDGAAGGEGCPYNCFWVGWVGRGGDDDNGDTREGIDPARVQADFVNGALDGGRFF